MRKETVDRTLLPVILIAVGILWLLIQIGFVPPGLVTALGRWWPLLLVGGGLDLLIPARRPAKVPFVAIAAVLMLLIGLVTPAGAGSDERQVREPLSQGVRSVVAEITTSHQPTTITTTSDPFSLIEADFSGGNPGRVSTSGSRDARVTVRPSRGGLPFSRPGRWDIALPTSVPLSLTVDGGSGALNLELDRASLASLEIDGSSGGVSAALPGNGAAYRAEVDGGSGSVELSIAPGASVDMEAEFGSGSGSVFVGEGSDFRLELRSSSGAISLDLPDSAPIRLEVRDDGSGRLRLPGFLSRRSGSGDTGVWESANYGNGGRVIEVSVRDVGSGSITIR